jgi:glutamyl-tRNA synthetase
VVLADWAQAFYDDVTPKAEDLVQHVTDAVTPVLVQLKAKLAACSWDKAGISAAIKEVLAENKEQCLKMPQLAMPVRVLVLGTPQTPSLDAVLELLPREKVLSRLQTA